MPRSRRAYLRARAIALGATLAGCSSVRDLGNENAPDAVDSPTDDSPTAEDTPDPSPTGTRIDDWQYDPTTPTDGGTHAGTAAQMATQAASGAIGLAAGGAKGVDNYRQNIEEDSLPLPSNLSYEGLFYTYLL